MVRWTVKRMFYFALGLFLAAYILPLLVHRRTRVLCDGGMGP